MDYIGRNRDIPRTMGRNMEWNLDSRSGIEIRISENLGTSGGPILSILALYLGPLIYETLNPKPYLRSKASWASLLKYTLAFT